MDSIKLRVSEDKFAAYLSIGKGSVFPSPDQIYEALAAKGICFGIDANKIDQICSEKEVVNDILIARGQPAKPETDALLEWEIGADLSSKPTITPTNRADFKQIHLFEPVMKDQLLIKKLPVNIAFSGQDVFGEEVSLDSSEIELPAGKNTYISDDGSNLYAAVNGVAVIDEGKLNVHEVYHVKGDVNYATGNIKYDGPVKIDGDVRSGFRIETTEDIMIGGNVEAASVYSQNGNITIQCGIVGKGRAKILAGGNLKCGFIQDATIGVRKDVEIQHYVINSSISAGGSVKVLENEGLIRGGTISSEKGILAKNIGSEKKFYTELKIRSYGTGVSQSQIWELSKKRSSLNLRLSSLKKRLAFLELLSNRLEDLSDQKRNEQVYLKNEIERLKTALNDVDDEEISLQIEASKQTINKDIHIYDTLYPNVRIEIGDLEYISDRPLKKIKFSRFNDQIEIGVLEVMADA